MRAVAFTRSLPVEDQHCHADYETPVPVPGPLELLIRVEAGEIRSTLTKTLHGLSAATLRQAHAKLEARSMIGKLSIIY